MPATRKAVASAQQPVDKMPPARGQHNKWGLPKRLDPYIMWQRA